MFRWMDSPALHIIACGVCFTYAYMTTAVAAAILTAVFAAASVAAVVRGAQSAA